jgi:peptide/nickel transport system permease protein
MYRFVGRRLLAAVPVLIIVGVAVFIILRLTPGDPAIVILGDGASPEQVAELRASLGLDQPIYLQFINWVGGILTGDLGYSYFLKQDVSTAILNHLAPTFYLAVFAQVIATAFAIPAGIIAARRQGTFVDGGVMGASLIGISIPSFLTALLLVLLFSVTWNIFPAAGYVGPSENFGQFLAHMALPTIALAGLQGGLIARMTRSSMIDTLSLDYVRTARAKGLTGSQVTIRHVFRNAAVPVLTVVGQSFGGLVAGAVVTETVFNLPGLGQLVTNSVLRRDLPLLQGVILTTAVLYVVVNLIVDVFYGALDPRARVDKAGRASQ